MRCGIWVDQRQAILVRLDGLEATTHVLPSGVTPRRRAGGSPGITAHATARSRPGQRAAGPQHALAEDRLERKHDHELKRYYERVADAVGDAQEIFVLGPGEARGELVKALERRPDFGERIVGVAAADKLTEPQLVALVRKLFGAELPRRTDQSPQTG